MIYEKSKAKSITADRAKIKQIVHSTITEMADIVGVTLGPGGRPVILERDSLSPLVTKDGVTVAKTLGVSNAEANIIIESAKEICLRTAKQAGDGTTTAIVLAGAITRHGLEFLEKNKKYNPQRMVNELNDLYNDVVVPFLAANAKKVKERHELINVATISANGDMAVATAAVDAVDAAGEDGQVLIEEEDNVGIRVETIDGCIVTSGLKDLGSIGLAFINDRAGQQAKMDNGLVFLYDGTMNDLKVPAAIQQAVEGTDLYGKPILVFAHGFSDVVLDKFAKTTKGGYTVVPVKTPLGGVANSRSMFLFDMAAYTDGEVFDPASIDEFINDDSRVESFGLFETAKVNMFECFLTSSDADDTRINERIAELKSIAQVAPNDKERMFAKAAISKLTGGVSTIWVGGGSELEAREKKARVEDAVEAVRSAIAEGVIPGGCVAHMKLQQIIKNHKDYKPSWEIMLNALEAPFNLLMINCGEDPEEVKRQLSLSTSWADAGLPNIAFDANRHEFVDPFSAGIIEPAKVCRVSMANALSVASLLVTLGGIVVVPRDFSLENQLALSKQAFKDMLNPESGLMGQE